MSKLAENLETFLIDGGTTPVPRLGSGDLEKNRPRENKAGVLNVTADYDTSMMPAYTTYKMVATVGCVFRVYDWEVKYAKADLRAEREREAREDIINVVFGEFRKPLLRARSCALQGDIQGACQNITDVLDSMFSLE